MNKKIKKIIFSMLTAYGLSITAAMDDGHSILRDTQSAAVQVVYREYLCSDEKQKVLDRIVGDIISIFDIYKLYSPGPKSKLVESFLESVESKNHDETHKILTENPDFNAKSIGFSKLVELVERYRKEQLSLLDEDRTRLSQSAKMTLYNK